jgi:hypothetical protein
MSVLQPRRGFQGEERGPMRALVIAAVALALLVILVFVGLYSYTDTTLLP